MQIWVHRLDLRWWQPSTLVWMWKSGDSKLWLIFFTKLWRNFVKMFVKTVFKFWKFPLFLGVLTFSNENSGLRSTRLLTHALLCQFLSMTTPRCLIQAPSQSISWKNLRKTIRCTQKIAKRSQKSTNAFSTLAVTFSRGCFRFLCLLLSAEKVKYRSQSSMKCCAVTKRSKTFWTATNTSPEARWHFLTCISGLWWNFWINWFQSMLKSSQNSCLGWLWCESTRVTPSTKRGRMNTLQSTGKASKNRSQFKSSLCKLLKITNNVQDSLTFMWTRKIQKFNKENVFSIFLMHNKSCFWQSLLSSRGHVPSESICWQLRNDSKMKFRICLFDKPGLFMFPFLISVIVKWPFLPPKLSVVE